MSKDILIEDYIYLLLVSVSVLHSQFSLCFNSCSFSQELLTKCSVCSHNLADWLGLFLFWQYNYLIEKLLLGISCNWKQANLKKLFNKCVLTWFYIVSASSHSGKLCKHLGQGQCTQRSLRTIIYNTLCISKSMQTEIQTGISDLLYQTDFCAFSNKISTNPCLHYLELWQLLDRVPINLSCSNVNVFRKWVFSSFGAKEKNLLWCH